MPHLFLPAEHSDRDLVLAGQVAELVRSDELYVTWTDGAGQAAAEIGTLMREPQHPIVQVVETVIGLAAMLCAACFRRTGAAAPARADDADAGLPDPLAPARLPRSHPAAGETA